MLKFTVVTSCFNAEKYISETIDSVVKQSVFTDHKCLLEYIIVDSNSTDKTNFIIENYKKKYPNIIHIIENDDGLYDGLSKGFKISTGDIICYLNAGDFFNKTAFKILNKVFQDKNLYWVTGLKVLYNEDSEIISVQYPYKYRNKLIQSGVYGKSLPFIQQESTFWRRKLLDEIDYDFLRSLKLSGDMYLWLKFSEKYELNIIFSYLSGFKYHSNQLTFKDTGKTDQYINETKKFIRKRDFLTYFYIILDAPFWFLGRNIFDILNFFSKNNITFSKKEKSWISNKGNKYYCWTCDFSQTNGEGITAKLFLESFAKENSLNDNFIFVINNKVKKSLYEINNSNKILSKKLNINDKYLAPYIGIFYLWYKYLTGNNVVYINFLPLWNFPLFLFLPPSTTLGPITGSMDFDHDEVKGFNKFFRKYLMLYFFKISCLILKFRYKKLIFNTNILEKILPEKVLYKSTLNFIFNKLETNQVKNHVPKKNREIDILFYIRFYPSKGTNLQINIINLLKEKYKITTFGDLTNISGVKEYGKISNTEVKKLCSKSKFAFLSHENFFSLFSKECIEHGTKVFFNKNIHYDKKLVNDKKAISVDYNDFDEILKKMETVYE